MLSTCTPQWVKTEEILNHPETFHNKKLIMHDEFSVVLGTLPPDEPFDDPKLKGLPISAYIVDESKVYARVAGNAETFAILESHFIANYERHPEPHHKNQHAMKTYIVTVVDEDGGEKTFVRTAT